MIVDNGSYGSRKVNVNYPSNSRNREPQGEKEKPVKVIKGKVVKVKKSLGKKFLETFIGEDIENITSYIIHDVLIPAAKSMLYDTVNGSFKMALFGDRKGNNTRRDGGVSTVSYNNCSSSGDQRLNDRIRESIVPRNKSRFDFDDIRLDSRGEAEEVLSHLVDLVLDYGQATVADLYDLVGIRVEYTDNKYGWRSLNRAEVERVRDGWLIRLPKPIQLD